MAVLHGIETAQVANDLTKLANIVNDYVASEVKLT